MWWLYQLLYAATLVVAGPILLLRRGGHYLATLTGRLGGHDGPPTPAGRDGVWLHAVSVGEAQVAATLARALPAELPLVVTTITPTGQERARSALSGRAAVAYHPFELGFAIERFLRRFAPRALVLVEGDLWPLALRAVRRRGLPTVVVNARVSDRTFPRLLRWRSLVRPLLLDRTSKLRGALLQLLEQPGVRDGDGSLVRERLQQADLVRGERRDLESRDDEAADGGVLVAKRDRQHRPSRYL